ncbi:MAG: monooxygenase, FAD-binding protein [Chloroflexi bacterium]|nr:monooxygenase, FAD-binding protein [Chloroflexota bacterium]
MTDVLIVGGGIAGSALAIMLGRRGVDVELFERDSFPREKPCGEGLMPAGVAALDRIGLREAVGGAPFVGVRYHVGSLVVAGRFPSAGGQPVTGVGQRRWRLDEVLFNAAAATDGVAARSGCSVDGPLCEGARVVGCHVGGRPRRAPLVVAADGLHSRFRRVLGLDAPPSRRVRVGLRTHFRLANGKEQPPWVEVFLGSRHELYVTPLPDREVLVAGLAERGALGRNADAALHDWIGAQPVLAERLEGAEQLTRVAGRSPLTRDAVAGVAPGVALLGDAAGFIDPITGGGMAQALVTAELLALHIVNGLGRGDAWLWEYEAERRALLKDYRLLTRAVLGLADRPRLARFVLTLLRAAPPVMSHLIGVAGGVRCLLPLERP